MGNFMVRKLEDYVIMLGEAEVDKVKALHQLVGDFKEDFLGNEILQNVLLNRGYEIEETRPKSYADVPGPAFNSKITGICLTYVEHIMGISTKPSLLAVKTPRIVIPGQIDETKIETFDGHDADKVEHLQKQWMTNHETREKIRDYHETLEKAMDEYAMQFILNCINHSRINFLPLDWKEEREIQERVTKAWDSKSYGVLDSAYYNMAQRFFIGVGRLWEELKEDDFGKLFVLPQEDISCWVAKGGLTPA